MYSPGGPSRDTSTDCCGEVFDGFCCPCPEVYVHEKDCAEFMNPIGIVGLAKKDDDIIGISFDILSLEALFLVPR